MTLRPGRYSINGTSLMGYIDISYAQLVEAFGEPHNEGDGYKVDAEWVLTGDGGDVVTIYNYKDGPNYLGPAGTPVEDIRDWHIGGRSRKAVDLVKEAFPNAEVRTW